MKCYVVDAFAAHLFEGNPAAVCVLDTWLSEEVMQLIAVENNLSETAFAVKNAGSYGLRWFTPGGEIDLCGHATLATAYVLMRFYEPNAGEISFRTKSGGLNVKRSGDRFEMDFPAYALSSVPVTEAMTAALGVRPLEAWMGRDLVCVLADERQVCDAAPNPELLLGLDGLLTHITARGSQYDCVSRTFAPKLHVAEDPVCGSGHCHMVPLWADKLRKTDLIARQASKRGGTLYCRRVGDRVKLAGKAVLYSEANLFV